MERRNIRSCSDLVLIPPEQKVLSYHFRKKEQETVTGKNKCRMLTSQSFKARISEAGIKGSLDSAYDSADEFKVEFYLNP